MRGRLAILITVVVVLVVLVVLNAASYVKVEREADLEFKPDRSTTNARATGTRALYDFLQQSGYKVTRWTQPPSALLRDDANKPSTFVVIGQVRVPFKREEAQAVQRWVEAGGRLVIIDRVPDTVLMPTSGGWRVSSELFDYPDIDSRPDDMEKMTAGVRPLAPAQPTVLTRDVESVMPSRFSARLHAYPTWHEGVGYGRVPDASVNASRGDEDEGAGQFESEDEPPPPPRPGEGPITKVVPPDIEVSSVVDVPLAPVRHIADWREKGDGALLVDYAYGRGRVCVLGDPYIVANSGIRNADNLQLAVNVVLGGDSDGLVAFDEFHQGLGGARPTGAFSLFAGTPVLWIFAQAGFIVLVFLWSRGRRFARPLPAPHVDRRSKLEFVASMAELQQRARAYDLAVENVYARTRRALARYAGLDPTAPREEIAARVASRSGLDRAQIEQLLAECEDVVAGGQTNARRATALVRSLRELERDLGIRMRAREIMQTLRGKQK